MKYLNEGFSQELYSKQKEIDEKLITYIKLAKQEIIKGNHIKTSLWTLVILVL